jgi:hypothetical protein
MAIAQSSGSFVMHGAREVLESGAVHIEQQVLAIEEAVDKNPGLAFDLSKTIIESACKTILADRGHLCEDGWDLPRLLKETTGKLRLVPDAFETRGDVTGSIKKTLGGLQTIVQGICELRNRQGFASHGRDAFAVQLESVQAALVARAADAVVNFLFRAHNDYPALPGNASLQFSDNRAFNEYVDEANPPVQIFDLSYRPSDVLFNVDLSAYRDQLANYLPDDTEANTDDVVAEQATGLVTP